MTADRAQLERKKSDRLLRVVQRAAEREALGRKTPEPSLGARLGQIGVLGWMIVIPALIGLFIGRWLDRTFTTDASSAHVFFSATLLVLGVTMGFWSAWRWMHGRGE